VLCSGCGVQLSRLRVGLESIVDTAPAATESRSNLRQIGT